MSRTTRRDYRQKPPHITPSAERVNEASMVPRIRGNTSASGILNLLEQERRPGRCFIAVFTAYPLQQMLISE